ncbi:hypothetical protein [Yoonia sp. BS5-3]|uniref:Uncharacterized protein n=1 Tax=Yoonia phaeophyticola TaxID=3137369 RepID=A0ABZ2UYW5_9RHOB
MIAASSVLCDVVTSDAEVVQVAVLQKRLPVAEVGARPGDAGGLLYK